MLSFEKDLESSQLPSSSSSDELLGFFAEPNKNSSSDPPNFSLREYVAKSRRRKIVKNWPFSEPSLQFLLKHGADVSILPPFELPDSIRTRYYPTKKYNRNQEEEEEEEALLVSEECVDPSVSSKTDESATKSRRKQRRLGKFRLIEEITPTVTSFDLTVTDPMASKICPVCKIFASFSNTTLNAHIDQCLCASTERVSAESKLSVPTKMKPRKKRLMVDIYETSAVCTLEDLDDRNGTTWASDLQKSRLKISAVDPKDNVDDADVYVDRNGIKLRILSNKPDKMPRQSVEEKKHGQDPKLRKNNSPINRGKLDRQLFNCKIPEASERNQKQAFTRTRSKNEESFHEGKSIMLQTWSGARGRASLKNRRLRKYSTEIGTKYESSQVQTILKKKLLRSAIRATTVKSQRTRPIVDLVEEKDNSNFETERSDGLKFIDASTEVFWPNLASNSLLGEDSRDFTRKAREEPSVGVESRVLENFRKKRGQNLNLLAIEDNDDQQSGSPASSVSTVSPVRRLGTTFDDLALKPWPGTHEKEEEDPFLRFSEGQEIDIRLPKKPTQFGHNQCCCSRMESLPIDKDRNKVANLQARTATSAFCAYSRSNSTDSSILHSPSEPISTFVYSDTSKSHILHNFPSNTTPKPVLRLMGKNLVVSKTEDFSQLPTNPILTGFPSGFISTNNCLKMPESHLYNQVHLPFREFEFARSSSSAFLHEISGASFRAIPMEKEHQQVLKVPILATPNGYGNSMRPNSAPWRPFSVHFQGPVASPSIPTQPFLFPPPPAPTLLPKTLYHSSTFP